jgi:hypothetical protein
VVVGCDCDDDDVDDVWVHGDVCDVWVYDPMMMVLLDVWFVVGILFLFNLLIHISATGLHHAATYIQLAAED